MPIDKMERSKPHIIRIRAFVLYLQESVGIDLASNHRQVKEERRWKKCSRK